MLPNLLLLPVLLSPQSVRMTTPFEPTSAFGSVSEAQLLGAADEVLYRAPPVGRFRVPVQGGPVMSSTLEPGGECSPDGNSYAFVRSDALWLADLASESAVELAQHFWVWEGASYRFSPDGSRLAFLPFPGALLGSVASDGSTPSVYLNLNVAGAQSDYRFTPDSSRLVFRTTDERLYVVPAGGGAPLRLDGAGTVAAFALTPDGTRAVFSAQVGAGRLGLHVVPLDGSQAPLLLSGALVPGGGGVEPPFLFSGDGARVVFRGDLALRDAEQLYSAPLDGSALPLALSGAPLLHRRVADDCALDASGTRVIFRGELLTSLRVELFSAPVDGSAPRVTLNGPLVAGGGVLSFRVGAGGKRVCYLADAEVDERRELFSARLDGTQVGVRLSGDPLAWADVEDDYQLAPNGLAVAFRMDRTTDGETRLYLRSLSGAGVLRELTDTSAAGVDAPTGFAFTPDGSRLVFRSNELDFDLLELFATDFTGTVRLNAPLFPGLVAGDIADFQLAEDGQRVVYRADREQDQRFELYSEGFGGRPLTKLSPPLASGDDVQQLALSPDGARVAYRTNTTFYTQPSDGSGTRVALASAFVPGPIEFSADGTRLVYVADQALHSVRAADGGDPKVLHFVASRSVGRWIEAPGTGLVVFEFLVNNLPRQLWRVPVDGSAPASALTASGPGLYSFLVSPDGQTLVYVADHDTPGVVELYRAAVDGSSPPAKLSGTLVAGGDVSFLGQESVQELGDESWLMAISPDSASVAFVADAEVDGVAELYSVPSDGSAAPLRIATMGVNADVQMLRISPDSARVVFRADADTDEVVELYSVPLDGSASPVKLNPPGVSTPTSSAQRFDFALSASTARVVFLGRAGSVQGLYSAPLDGSQPAQLVSGALDARLLWDLELELSPDGRWALVEGSGALAGTHLVAVDGSVPPRRLGPAGPGPMEWTPGAGAFARFTADARRVAFLADSLDSDPVRELFLGHVLHAARPAR